MSHCEKHHAGPYEKVFVFYPRGERTGGPEALHQLVDALRRHEIDAFLVPFAKTVHLPRNPAYAHYDAPEASRVMDAKTNAVVVPEIYLDGLKGISEAQKFCWWLSIDNSPVFRHERALVNAHGRQRSRLGRTVLARPLVTAALTRHRWRRHNLTAAIHLAQSQYAWAYLYSRYNITSSALSDYTVRPPSTQAFRKNGPVVTYNPKRGGKYVEALRASQEFDVEWLPITGMSPEQVGDALEGSDVYLDLGHQPGKDRLPREAALAGAVTIILRRGAGAFSTDAPIPFEHKVSADGDLISNASKVLHHVLNDLSEAKSLQLEYRRIIAAERLTFEREVSRIFAHGDLGGDHHPWCSAHERLQP